MQHLQPHSTLQGGKYRIESVLGQGGFGITYLATQPLMLDRKLAIKEFFLKDYFTRNETTAHVTCSSAANRNMADQYRHKFIKEAQTLLQISHPYLVKVLDIFEENDTAYYVMEYAEGTTLHQLVKERGPLPEDEAVGYVLKVAEVLGFIHDKQVTHLDVKPSNIIRGENTGQVKLIDFGASKHYDAQRGEQTTIATPVYSPGYAPVEQYKQGGVSTFSPQSDIYSLGATLYKLVTGNTPPEPSELISHPLAGFPATLSDTTRGTILLAMQLNRGERPQTMHEFIDFLTGKKEIPDAILDADNEHTLVINDKPQTTANDAALISDLRNALDEKQANIDKLTAELKEQKGFTNTYANALDEANSSKRALNFVLAVCIVGAAAIGIYAFYLYAKWGSAQQELGQAKSDVSILRGSNDLLTKQIENQKATLATFQQLLDKFGASKLVASEISVKNQGEDYGETIYSRNTTYIYPRVEITSLISGEKEIWVKFYGPMGLSHGNGQANGTYYSNYTYKNVINVTAYKTETFELSGWGGEKKGYWGPGNYRFEFYYDGKLIGKKSFTIH